MADRDVVVVTGAGGALGTGIVARLIDSGYHVAALDRSLEALGPAAQAWTQAGRSSYHLVAADQTDRYQIDDALAATVAEHGPIHGVVANAGFAKFGSFLEMPPRDWQRHVDINLNGTFHVSQAAARHMARERAGGWITVIASNLALSHADQVGAYCVTKAALLNLVRTAAAELGVHRIRVNAVLPGVIETAMTQAMLERPGVRAGLLAKTPLGRLGTVDDVAALVGFLASPAAAWITGASILADGGQSIYGQPSWVSQDRTSAHEPNWTNGYATYADSQTNPVAASAATAI